MDITRDDAMGLMLHVDAMSNAFDYLEMAEHFLVLDRPSKWKWVSIALYHALYGFMLEALGGTWPHVNDASDPEQRSAILLNYQCGKSIDEIVRLTNKKRRAAGNRKRPVDCKTVQKWVADPKAISFDEALRRMSAKRLGVNRPSRPAPVIRLGLKRSQHNDIVRLAKEFRNRFEHFMPMGWSIQLQGMPRILLAALDAIQFVALESRGVQLSKVDEERISMVCLRIKLILMDEHVLSIAERHR